jgi:hypothetical protein
VATSSETSEWSTEGSSTNVQSFEANWPGKPGARRDGEPQRRVGPLTVNVEGLLWGRTHATLDIDPTRLIQSRSAFNVTSVNPEDALLIAGLKAFAAGADGRPSAAL